MSTQRIIDAAQALVDAVDGDIFTDAPECTEAVQAVFYAARLVEIAILANTSTVAVTFTAADVPDFVADPADFMDRNGKHIRDRLIELGNEVIHDLAGEEFDPFEED
ncbi:hypothetical protein [Sphingopyxis sp.]|jgi:hypothetical protein|uniref:hypothetical protein n=1 Tax=Sphingopyxis sp. TaxID=1908224 RepID=UPI003F6F130A